MKPYLERMIKEHAELTERISKLENHLYGNDGLNQHTFIENNKTQEDLFRNMAEYGNKCIQLSSMRIYLTALECRLNNNGIFFEDGQYLQRIAKISNDGEDNPNTEIGNEQGQSGEASNN